MFAYEADFIDADQLLRAVGNWTKRPDTSLVDLLVADGSLSTMDVSLLETMWAEQTSQLVSDETLGQVQTTREPSRLATGKRPAPETATQEAPTDYFVRHRLEWVSHIASGGLGRVSMAHDQTLNRRVAIKEMLPKFAQDATARLRFAREAELTGQLEHPAIVPIHGLGLTKEGAPFYSMRLIEGRNLRELAEEFHMSIAPEPRFHSLEFRRLLNSFIMVCHAVEHAHSRHVLHRDIKPANIIVGDHGETMLVDWGLAKSISKAPLDKRAAAEVDPETTTASFASLSHPDDQSFEFELTDLGSTVGTPAYMSPEQATGAEKISTASDIFSLGATFYFLLTGTRPYQAKTAAEIMHLASRGEFLPPRSVHSQLPVPLEAICLRAMALEPEDRYASASALAEDIERWLADQSVSAYREPVTQRISRLARRHRTLARVILTAVALIAVLSSTFAILLSQKNRIVEQQRSDAQILAAEKTELATREQAARLSAGKQNRLAISTLRSVVWNIQRKLAGLPETQAIRRDILTTALSGLGKVETTLADKELVDRDMMTAHNDIGMIYLLVGNSIDGESTNKARTHFQLALEIAQALQQLQPDDPTARRDVSIAWEHLGDVHLERADWDAAEEAYRAALNSSLSLLDLDPESANHRRDIAFGWEKVGDIELKRGRVDEARHAFEEAHRLYLANATAQPNDLQAQRDLTVSMQKLGNRQMADEEFEKAADSYQACLNLVQRQLDAGSKVVQPRDRSVLLNKLGEAKQQLGLTLEAVAAFEEGLTIARQIADADPGNVQAQRDLAYSMAKLTDALAESGDLVEARAVGQQSLSLRESLANQDQDNLSLQGELASSLIRLGKLEKRAENLEGARDLFIRARTILESFPAETLEGSPSFRDMLQEAIREAGE